MSLENEKIKFKSTTNEDRSIEVACFGDTNATKKGLVVIQEWWGLNKQIREEADLISKNGGFITMAPDLYRGKLAENAMEAEHLMTHLDWKGAIEDIRGCVHDLINNRGCKKVGVTGFCMGGALTFAAAALIPEVSAAAPFYGIPDPGLCDIGKISIPLQCHFGNKDPIVGFSSPEDQEKLKKYLTEKKVNYEFHSYDAAHAFTNTKGENYVKEAADLALSRMYAFMNKNLE